MAKFNSIIAIIGITLTFVAAEPPRSRLSNRLGNLKLFARQESVGNAAPSSAPYTAAGVTPEIPFDLPTETEAPLPEPDQTYGPPEPTPDKTYLPPEPTPDKTYGPPEPTPDQTYGPPEEAKTHDKPAIEEPDAEVLPQSGNLLFEKIIQPRKNLRTRSRTTVRRSRSAAFHLPSAPFHHRFNAMDATPSKPVLIYTLH